MLVNKDSTEIRLIDFGLACRTNKNEDVRAMCGTTQFISPEVINYDPVTPATDLWSIGVITYVLLSGFSPFAGDTDPETLSNITKAEWDFDDPVFEDISEEAKDFISKLLIKKQRFVTITTIFIMVLRNLCMRLCCICASEYYMRFALCVYMLKIHPFQIKIQKF